MTTTTWVRGMDLSRGLGFERMGWSEEMTMKERCVL